MQQGVADAVLLNADLMRHVLRKLPNFVNVTITATVCRQWRDAARGAICELPNNDSQERVQNGAGFELDHEL